jgi:rare lipoprotein A
MPGIFRLQRAALAGLVLLCAAPAAAGEPLSASDGADTHARYSAVGWASWYGDEFRGRRTADGERFDGGGLTAAHRTMPLPCYARVTNLGNGRSIVVRVNDRGPFVRGRLLDVSARVAGLLGFRGGGVAKVKVEYVGKASPAGGDERTLLASLKAPDSPDEAVSAYAPSPPVVDVVAALSALAAARRAANAPSPIAAAAPSSPFGKLAPSPYGDLVRWADAGSAAPVVLAAAARP